MEDTRRSWLSDAAPDFLINQFVSTVGAMVVGIVASFIPAFLIAAVTRNNSGGNWADHVAEQDILRAAGEPYFLFPILAAFLLGALRHRYSHSATALWVWLLPATLLAWNVLSWRTGGFRSYWPDVWDNYFGRDCGSSECIYELLVTAPFYTSLSYALGWASRRSLKARSQ